MAAPFFSRTSCWGVDRRRLRSPHDVQRHGLMRISNPDFKKIYDSQMDFRNDENLWWQVAEFSYESFMIRTRPKG